MKNLNQYIEVNPAVQHGKPCLRGTRTPVYVILDALATGMSFEEVQKEFAPLSQEGILACISYAALLADERELLTR